MKRLLATLSVSLLFSSATPGYASSFGCESVAGSVIFKDTFYGALTGTALAGLYTLTQNKDKSGNKSKTISHGAAIGGAFGFGLGVVEVALRECPHTLGQQKSFTTSIVALPTDSGSLASGLRLNWNF